MVLYQAPTQNVRGGCAGKASVRPMLIFLASGLAYLSFPTATGPRREAIHHSVISQTSNR